MSAKKEGSPKKAARPGAATNPKSEAERAERLAKAEAGEGLRASPDKLTPTEKRLCTRQGAKAINKRRSASRADNPTIPDHMFPKLNEGLRRFSPTPGRMTDYQDEFPEYVIDWSARGKSKVWIAAELRVSVATLDSWTKRYPELADAFKIGAALAQRYWEDNGESGMRERTFSAAIWKMIMSSRFPADWQENKKVELGLDTSFLGLWDAVSKGATVVIADEVVDEEPGADGDA